MISTSLLCVLTTIKKMHSQVLVDFVPKLQCRVSQE